MYDRSILVEQTDPELWAAIEAENTRQEQHIDPIASENFAFSNKNAIPNDPEKPMVASGVRIGTPALTTRGFRDEEARLTAHLIADVLDNPRDAATLEAARAQVHALTRRCPVYR